MQILSPEEVKKEDLAVHRFGGWGKIARLLEKLNVGQGLRVLRCEYRLKTKIAIRVYEATKDKKLNKLLAGKKFRSHALANNQGWLITRIK